MNVRDLVNRAVTKYGEWNYHWKSLVSFVKNESGLRDSSKITTLHAKWISQVAIYHRIWNINCLSNWNAE
jgi:hypothetical protein